LPVGDRVVLAQVAGVFYGCLFVIIVDIRVLIYPLVTPTRGVVL
jgi:hypothetical protein